MSGRPNAPVQRRGTFWQSMRAVGWSFFGIRHSTGLEHDQGHLSAAQVVIAGLVGGAIFVIALVALVHWVVGSGIAASR